MIEKEILLGDNIYKLIIDNNNVKLRRFNNKTKMWINIFLPKEHNQELENEFLDILKKDYIDRKIKELSN